MYTFFHIYLYICSPLTKNLAMIEGQLQSTMANTAPKLSNNVVTVVAKTRDSISIRWTKATDAETPNSKLLYTVTWCKTPYVWDNKVRKIGDRIYDNDSYTIKGLDADCSYDIIVYVRDENGAENCYAKKTVTTPVANVPNAIPVIANKSVTARNVTNSSVSLYWQKATDNETAQKDLRYVITYQPVGGTRKQTSYYVDIDHFALTGLTPNTSYQITVWVYDGKNFATYNAITVKTASTSSSQTTSSAPTNDEERRKQIREGLLAYSRSDKEKVAKLEMEKEARKDEIVTVNGGACLITHNKVSVNDLKGELFPENDGNIFPGSLVYVDKYLAMGTPRKVNFGKKNNFGTVKLSADFILDSKADVVAENTLSGVREGISQIMRKSFGSSFKPSGQYATDEQTYSDVRKMAIEANCTVDYLAKIDVKTKTTTNNEKIYKMKKINQQFYKITAEIENGDLSSVFGKDVTWADIKDAIDHNGPIAIVTEVTYGRYGFYFHEYNKNSFNFVGSQKVTYQKNCLDLSQDIDQVTTSTRNWGYVFGGSAETAAKALASYDKFDEEFHKTPIVGPDNQARPISFTVVFLSSDTICKKQITGEYYEEVYRFCPSTIKTCIHNGAYVVGGAWLYVDMWYDKFRIVDKRDGEKAIDVFKKNIKWNHKWTERGLNEENIRLPEGEYFMPKAQIRITHKHGGGPAFDTQVSSSGDIDISDGTLYLEIGGSCVAGKQDPYFEDTTLKGVKTKTLI